MGSRLLAGLGQGLQTFASLQHQRDLEEQARAEKDAEVKRQIARDAVAKALADANIRNLDADNARADTAASLAAYKVMFPEAKPVDMSSGYDLRPTGPNGRLQYIPKPGTQGGPIDTGFDSPPPAPSVVTADGGVFRVPRRGGAAEPVPTGEGSQLQPQVPESANAAVQANNKLIEQVDAAIAALEKDPNATGLLKGIVRGVPLVGPQMLAGTDPEGDPARVALNAVGTSAIHEMYGGNLTKTEVGRTDWAPDVKFGAEANITRLKALKAKAMAANQTIQEQHPNVRGARGERNGMTPPLLQRPSSVTPQERAALKAQGYTDAEIDAIP